jgi:aminopeptidase N
LVASLALSLLAAGPKRDTPPTPSDTSPEDRRAIESALKARVDVLLQEKDENGASMKRGSYSHTFRKMDDATYQVSFTIDTAGKESLTTERYLFTLKRDPAASRWSIDKEELQDTYRGLIRSVPADESFRRFERFMFDREGLKVSATKGSLFIDTRGGKPFWISFAADDLSYSYEPPLARDKALFGKLKKDKAEKVTFTPETAGISCDPSSCEELLASAFQGLREASREEASTVLRDTYDQFAREQKENRRENAFSGFYRPYEPDRRVVSVSLKKKGADEWLGVEIDNWEPREVSFWVSGFGPLYTYHSEETRKIGGDPYDLEKRDDAYARDYQLEGLTGVVEMGMGDGELLTADLTFDVVTKRELREIPFRIAQLREQGSTKKEIKRPRMTVNSIQDAQERELTWVRTGPVSGLIVLPETVAAGSRMPLRMHFENRDSIYKLTTSYSYVARSGWLPFVRFGDMIRTFDLTVKVPSKYKTLGIGRKVSESVAGGISTTRWVSEMPVEFPTVIFGDYVEASSKVKAKKIDGTEIPVTIHVDRVSMGDWEIAPKSLPALADDAANSLNLYREIFGEDYPYSKLDLVNDPFGFLYGQAPSSIVYLGSGSFWATGTLGSMGGADLTKFVGSLVPHEVGHQWWGSLVSNANDGNYWFVESLAEYSASLYVEALNGRKAYLDHVKQWRKTVLETDLLGSVQDASTQWSGDGFASYQAAVYNKGPYAFHILRSTWGDEKLYAFLKMLAKDLKGKEIVTRDIQKVAEKAYGNPMEWFFDQWIRGIGLPRYTFTHKESPSEDGQWVVEGTIDQQVVVGLKKDLLEDRFFEAMVPITVTCRNGKEYQKKLVVRGASTPFRFKIPDEPKEVVLNKNGEVLALDVRAGQGS